MHHSIPAEHARHDLELIAGHAAGDLTDSERSRADAVLSSCAICTDLRRDLVAIASATRALPGPAAAPRDYRLTETQAAGLRRGGWIKSLLRPFAAPGSTTRPMAMAFTSLGLAGLLVANILPALLGGLGGAASLAPAAGAGGGLPAATAAPAPAASQGGPVPVAAGPRASASNDSEYGSLNQPTAAAGGGDSKANQGATSAPEVAVGGAAGATNEPAFDRLLSGERDRSVEETNWMLVGSFGLLAIGVALFGLRFLARRVR